MLRRNMGFLTISPNVLGIDTAVKEGGYDLNAWTKMVIQSFLHSGRSRLLVVVMTRKISSAG